MLSQVPPRARAGWFGGSAASGGSRAAVQPGPESAPHRAAPRGARVRPEPARRSRGEVVGARAAGGRPGSRRQCLPGSQEAREAGEERRARPALGAAARLRRRASKDESAAPETAAPTPKAAPEPRDPARLGPGRWEAARTPRCPQPGETIAARWVTSPRAASEDSRLRMGNHAGKRDFGAEKGNKDSETNRGEHEKKRNTRDLSREISEDSDVFGAADVVPNNGAPSQDTAVTDSKRTADPKNAWPEASPADPGGRPHLVRLFSRDAPGREDNTFKDRPSESDELQTIQEDSAAAPGAVDAMAAQKRPSQRSKYLASASTMDHARHGFLPRHRDTGILDSLGRFFGSDRGAPKRGSGKVPWLKQSKSPLGPHARSPPGLCNMYQDGHHAARTTHYGSLPQKAQHGRPQDENPVVHFFKNIVTPRTPPPSQGKGRGLSLSRFSWVGAARPALPSPPLSSPARRLERPCSFHPPGLCPAASPTAGPSS
uniref:Myelin basic protein n=1 Tax=Bos indicus x Bos taurus TaxID=30522 RepID=A0A4W2IDJ1_BOBOX